MYYSEQLATDQIAKDLAKSAELAASGEAKPSTLNPKP
jgi:hypothetical protein